MAAGDGSYWIDEAAQVSIPPQLRTSNLFGASPTLSYVTPQWTTWGGGGASSSWTMDTNGWVQASTVNPMEWISVTISESGMVYVKDQEPEREWDE